jgi:TonB family protein
MKATVSRRHPVGRTATAGPLQPVDQGHAPFASSVLMSLVLHGIFILGMLGSAWLLSRTQPYKLTSQTVYLAGDSPIIIDQVPGEGGGASGVKQESKEPGGTSKVAQVETAAEPAVEKFVPPVEKPVLPPPKPVPEKAVSAPPPRPVIEKAAPPPPKPVVEKPVPPTPAPKPVVEKAVPAPPKPPPEAMTLAQKQTKPPPVPVPSTSTPTEAQQKMAKLRERQLEQETVEVKTTTEAQQKVAKLREQQAQQDVAEQRVASLRTEQAEKQSAQQRVAALRARVGSGGSGEETGSSGGSGSSGSGPGSGTAGTGSGGGAPGGGRGTGTAGAGGVGTGGLSGIRLRNYQAELQAKVQHAWNIPPRSKGLQAVFFLSINRAGQVEQARLVRGSGNALFDESLQRAIKQAQPFPALPEDFTNRTLEVTMPFIDKSK